MRIGLIAPPWVPVPPPRYGGTEVVIDNLARGLRDRGHDVCLFTLGDSTCPVRRDFLYTHSRDPMGTTVEEAAHVLAAYEALSDMELIHDHTVLGPLLAAQRRPWPPVVTTHHGPFTPDNQRILAATGLRVPIVAISHDQAGRSGAVPIAAVIHHGIDLEVYRPGPGDGGYLVFVGRMSPDKGVEHAIHVARAAGVPIVLATKIRDRAEQDYYCDVIRPLVGPGVDLWVEPALAERLELTRRAAALVNPIDWPEPFGLVMAESLAVGTPVLAYPRGAAPEIVEHGHTGFLCADETEMIASVHRIPEIDRAQCRAAAEKRFAMTRMARDYEALYRAVLDESRLNAKGPGVLRHRTIRPHIPA